MALRDTSLRLDRSGVKRCHVAIHEWLLKANLPPVSTVIADQVAINEKMIRVNSNENYTSN